jgi:hypothetical protein
MDCKEINGKKVFIVDAHHEALAAWAEGRRSIKFAPHLISFDSHTDSHRAFLKHLGLHWDSPELVEQGEALVRKTKFDDAASISRAIEHLAHDEHIDCARRVGIISRVFIFLGAIGDGVRLPNTKVFDDDCLPNCSKLAHDDECQRLLADHLLEPLILRPRINSVSTELGMPIEDAAYILDIDLDVFLTRRAATPHDPSLFRQLLHHAKAITIAREPDCVEVLRLAGEDITPGELEALVNEHIEHA